ncbi:MAG TPA: RdgB/HAM1 family non-canonical purine NTP pyrophosphatase, partial [Terriglobia bacterium]|nr:RdgB/HAM1 family non-canonical purine NTP pyrophosphatase [Terriglobia bacterium]
DRTPAEDSWSVKTLTIATRNPGKVHEVRLALKDLPGWKIEPLPAGIPEIDETGSTFIENAILKATHYSRFVEGLALADDSGLCVKSLDNRPGVWTDRYGATSELRNQGILNELEGMDDREAAFYCAFAIATAGSVIWTSEGKLKGQITQVPVGDAGFGFDPIFLVPELGKTLAQLTSEEKNQWSARGQSLNELQRYLSMI